jgi:hypothetical protein
MNRIALVAIFVGLGACTPRYGVRFRDPSGAPLGASITADRISLPEGIVVRAFVDVTQDGDVIKVDATDLVLNSADLSIARALQAKDDFAYAFVGVQAGTTTVTAAYKGKIIARVPAEITAQVP